MKTNAIFFLSMMMSVMTYGQMNPQFQPVNMLITSPEFPALKTDYTDLEEKSIHDYLRDNVKHLQHSADYCIPGTEVIAFIVTSTGELSGFRVINSVSSVIDEEVIRVLKETSGSWKPGFINGEPAAMEREVSLIFIPNNNYDIVKEAKKHLDKGNKMLFINNNPKKALKCFNEAFGLLPNEESILAGRSICKYEMGDKQGAINDCSRIIALNSSHSIQHDNADPIELLYQLMGYADEATANNRVLLREWMSD